MSDLQGAQKGSVEETEKEKETKTGKGIKIPTGTESEIVKGKAGCGRGSEIGRGPGTEGAEAEIPIEVVTEEQTGLTGAGTVIAVLNVTRGVIGTEIEIGTETGTGIGKASTAPIEISHEGMTEGVNPGTRILQRYLNINTSVFVY